MALDHGVRLRQVLADGAVALAQVGNGVHAQRVHAHVEPEAHGLEHLFDHQRIVEVEVGLVGEEAVPVVGLGRLVPGPVGFFRVGEDDARVLVELVGLRPDIHVALRRAGRRQAGGLEPRMLIAGVIDDQLDHHLHVALVSGVEECLEIVQRSVGGIDIGVVGDVVAVIAQRRGEEWQKPDAGNAEVLQIVEPREQAGKIADAVAVRVGEGANVELVDDGVLVPERIGRARHFFHVLVLRAAWTMALFRCNLRGSSPEYSMEDCGRPNARPRCKINPAVRLHTLCSGKNGAETLKTHYGLWRPAKTPRDKERCRNAMGGYLWRKELEREQRALRRYLTRGRSIRCGERTLAHCPGRDGEKTPVVPLQFGARGLKMAPIPAESASC